MAEQPTLTQGLTAFLTPLATVGAGVYQTQTKSQINTARIRAGKQPCTGQFDQPADCPAIFAPGVPGVLPDGTTPTGYGPEPSSGPSPLLIIGILVVGVGIAVVLLSPKKPKPAAARRRKKSRK